MFVRFLICFANAEENPELNLTPEQRSNPEQWRFAGNKLIYGLLYGEDKDTSEALNEKEFVEQVLPKPINYVEGIDDIVDADHGHSNSLETLDESIVFDNFFDYAHDDVTEENATNESKMLTRDELLATIKDLHRINLPQHILDDFPMENEEQKLNDGH